MRTAQTRHPSFPIVKFDEPISPKDGDEVWQALCGDRDRWRAGLYSPAQTSAVQIMELEQHDCPELFCLLEGRMTLVLARNRRIEKLELQPKIPVLVSAPHAGFCPDGPHTGRALVIERDSFDTKYATPGEFTTNQTLDFEPVDVKTDPEGN